MNAGNKPQGPSPTSNEVKSVKITKALHGTGEGAGGETW